MNLQKICKTLQLHILQKVLHFRPGEEAVIFLCILHSLMSPTSEKFQLGILYLRFSHQDNFSFHEPNPYLELLRGQTAFFFAFFRGFFHKKPHSYQMENCIDCFIFSFLNTLVGKWIQLSELAPSVFFLLIKYVILGSANNHKYKFYPFINLSRFFNFCSWLKIFAQT